MPSNLPVQLRNLIGTQAFLPALLTHIRTAANSSTLPLDPVIFQSILLCLIAGDKHVILRTPEEDIALTVKLTVWTLSFIFNLSTRKLKIRPTRNSSRSNSKSSSNLTSDATGAFLRSLFLPSPSSDSNSNYTSQDEETRGEGYASDNAKQTKHNRRSRTPKHGNSSPSTTKSRPAPDHARARSYPSNTGSSGHNFGSIGRATSPESMLMQSSISSSTYQKSHETGAISNPTPSIISHGILKPTPVYPSNHATMPGLPHAFTDPLPLPPSPRKKKKSESRSSYVSHTLRVPQALVVSGLENASDEVHKAFSTMLTERNIVLRRQNQKEESNLDEDVGDVWALPEDFIAVYVCSWNARERPAIHKTLLDKFAMSTNVFVSQSVRREFNLLSFSPTVINRPFHSNDPFSHSNPNSPSPGYPMVLPPIQTYTPPIFTKPLPLHRPHHSSSTTFSIRSQPTRPDKPLIPPSLIKTLRAVQQQVYFAPELLLYLSDIFSATRHCSRLDAMLLTARSIKDAQDLIKSTRVLGTDLTGGELIRPDDGLGDADASDTADADSEASYQDPGEDPFEEDIIFHDARSTFDPGDEHQGLLGSQEGPGVNTSVAPPRAGDVLLSSRVLDVSEVHVARIAPRVISHRVRVRDGPEDEILASALFGATFRPPPTKLSTSDDAPEKPLSVKNVLVQILADV